MTVGNLRLRQKESVYLLKCFIFERKSSSNRRAV